MKTIILQSSWHSYIALSKNHATHPVGNPHARYEPVGHVRWHGSCLPNRGFTTKLIAQNYLERL